MFTFESAARAAAVGFCSVALIAAVPAGTAFGATVVPEISGVAALPTPAPAPIEPASESFVLPAPAVSELPAGKPSLAALVRAHGDSATADGELKCLATAVYFEAKGEPLAGQLAVAQVIMNRAQSGRFARTLCGVVKQPSQFSFVRGGGFPAVRNTAQWTAAIGVANVAMKRLYKGPAADALYFHARRVAPGWGKRPLASVGNHIFYR